MSVGDMMDSILEAEYVSQIPPPDAHTDQYQVPVDGAGQSSPVYEPGPMLPEDPMPAVPEQPIPEAMDHAEADEYMDDGGDDVVIVVDIPEDPPVIIILRDLEEDGVEAEPEAGQDVEIFEIDDDEVIVVSDNEESEDDPEEVLFHDGDWDPDTDADSDVSIYTLEVAH